MNTNIRPEAAGDEDAVRRVQHFAFGREAEARLVDALQDGGHARLSLVAERAGRVVGHVLFSDLSIVAETGPLRALSLAPTAVLPEFQRQGVGSALVRRGLEECRRRGCEVVVVLGDPHFYRRFGFSAEAAGRLESPYACEAFMAVMSAPGPPEGIAGRVIYPPPFQGV